MCLLLVVAATLGFTVHQLNSKIQPKSNWKITWKICHQRTIFYLAHCSHIEGMIGKWIFTSVNLPFVRPPPYGSHCSSCKTTCSNLPRTRWFTLLFLTLMELQWHYHYQSSERQKGYNKQLQGHCWHSSLWAVPSPVTSLFDCRSCVSGRGRGDGPGVCRVRLSLHTHPAWKTTGTSAEFPLTAKSCCRMTPRGVEAG